MIVHRSARLIRVFRLAAACLARGLLPRLQASLLGLAVTLPALADTSTLTLAPASVHVADTPVQMVFPVTRSGDSSYDAVLDFHTSNGTASAGIDYTARSGRLSVLGGSASAGIPVTIIPTTPSGPSSTFQMQLDSAVSVLTPTFAGAATISRSNTVGGLVGADLNGDGKLDIVAVEGGQLTVQFNTATTGATTPSFAAEQTFATPCFVTGVTTVDLNGDGKPDVVYVCMAANSIGVLLNTTAAHASTASFTAAQNFATPAGPIAINAADLNGDSKPDLVITNQNDNSVSVLLNTTAVNAGSASFAALQTLDLGGGASPSALASADLNGDGKTDLIVTEGGSNKVAVLLNNTAGNATTASFAAPQLFATGNNPSAIVAFDVNGDGKPDLALTNFADDSVTVLLNTTTTSASTASFATQPTLAAGGDPHAIIAADINGDGKPDLVVPNASANTVSVFVNYSATGGSTGFTDAHTYATGSADRLVALDINGDGKPDLIGNDTVNPRVTVLLNTTAAPPPSFAAAQNLGTGGYSNGVTSADINGDGKLDLIEVDRSDNTVSVFLNTTPAGASSPTYAARSTFATGSLPWAVAVADLNGDGKPDIVAANFSGSSVSVLLNQTAAGASTASFAHQVAFATNASPISIAIADINGDGKPDLIVADAGASDVAVLRNTTAVGATTPSFAGFVSLPAGSAPSAVASADLNGDGKADIVVANQADGTVTAFRNTTTVASTPSFVASPAIAVGANPYGVAIADFDGDGKRDVVVATYGALSVTVLANATAAGGALAFAPAQTFEVFGPYAVTTADIDGDGRPDVVVARPGNNTAAVLLNTSAPGAIGFAGAIYLSVGGSPTAIAVTDANGDGHIDVVSANGNANALSLLLNTQALATIAGSPATGTIVHDLVVTASSGNFGSISPAGAQTVAYGAQAVYTVSPLQNHAAAMAGTCGGTLNGTQYTTNTITADCTVVANFTFTGHYVTSSGGDHGSISPATTQAVADGGTLQFSVMADADYSASVGGTCGGTLNGTQYITDAISADCTVVAQFVHNDVTVTPLVAEHGNVTPNTPQLIAYASSTQFTITPDAGFVAIVSGTCGGTLADGVYTTSAVNADCTVIVGFSDRIFADDFEVPQTR